MVIPQGANQRWPVDFLCDALIDVRRFHRLAVVDDFTRGGLGLVADKFLSGVRVARELTGIVARRGSPCIVVFDNVLRQEHLPIGRQQISVH